MILKKDCRLGKTPCRRSRARPKIKHSFLLNDTDREELEPLLRDGKHASRKVLTTSTLLKVAAGFSDQQHVDALSVERRTTCFPIDKASVRITKQGDSVALLSYWFATLRASTRVMDP